VLTTNAQLAHALYAKYGRWFDLTKQADLTALREIGAQVPPRKRQNIEEQPDPFADEAQTQTHDEDTPLWEVEDQKEDVKVEEKKTVVEFGGGDRLSVTLKQHKGYEAAWIVLKGDTPADILKTFQDENFKKLMDWTKKASESFQEGFAPAPQGGNTGQASSGSQNRTQGRPAAATDGPLGPQYCNHGQKKYWSKYDEVKNEMVQIYFCPAQKNDPNKCKPQYVN
jgi:hypothetical protein